ncbi:hypothetical protein AMECASPLE_001534 [Ameca splendens]|uniref:Uncharacterized protein n=1 Tax=Ameca splendens TaxID=208324 RepID=A0ABV0XB32_9TELE
MLSSSGCFTSQRDELCIAICILDISSAFSLCGFSNPAFSVFLIIPPFIARSLSNTQTGTCYLLFNPTHHLSLINTDKIPELALLCFVTSSYPLSPLQMKGGSDFYLQGFEHTFRF